MRKQVMLVGGDDRNLRRFRDKLAPLNVDLAWHHAWGHPAKLPKGCEAVLACTDALSHPSYYKVRALAAKANIPCVGVSYDWLKSLPTLIQQGLVLAPDAVQVPNALPEADVRWVAPLWEVVPASDELPEEVSYPLAIRVPEPVVEAPMQAVRPPMPTKQDAIQEAILQTMLWWDAQSLSLRRSIHYAIYNFDRDRRLELDLHVRDALRKRFEGKSREFTSLVLLVTQPQPILMNSVVLLYKFLFDKALGNDTLKEVLLCQTDSHFRGRMDSVPSFIPEYPPNTETSVNPAAVPALAVVKTPPAPAPAVAAPTAVAAPGASPQDMLMLVAGMFLDRGQRVNLEKRDDSFVLLVDGVTVRFST